MSVTSMVEDPTPKARKFNFKKYQGNTKKIIYDSMKDNLMYVISPLKTVKECFETLTNKYENKAQTQNSALKKTLCNLNMERDC